MEYRSVNDIIRGVCRSASIPSLMIAPYGAVFHKPWPFGSQHAGFESGDLDGAYAAFFNFKFVVIRTEQVVCAFKIFEKADP
jgi:hypothetical protein